MMKRLGKSFAVLSFGALTAAAIALFSHTASAQEPTTGRKFAFLVGVEKYSHGKLHDLDFPENDVEELADVLNLQGFKTVLLTTRLGKNDASRMPTQQNVWNGLRAFLKENKPTKRDLMLVGLAGHGIQPLGSDESYFCPADANPTIKEGTKNAPANPETLISVGEMLKTLDDSGIGYKLLVVDACRNDPSVRGRRGMDHVNVAALPEQTGVLLSCKAGEFSFEHKSLGKRGHGAFFFNVIEGLKGAAKDEDGDVTWDSLGSYVRKKVPAKVRELFGTDGGEQNPNPIGNINGVPAVLARIESRPLRTIVIPSPKEDPEADRLIAETTEAIRKNPNHAPAYANRGLGWYRKNEFDKAIADYNEAIRLDPKNGRSYCNRGGVWADIGEYDKAISDCDEAIRLDPKDAAAYNNRGATWKRKGEIDKAIADLGEAIRLDPKDAPTYNNRGVAWNKKGEIDKAIADFGEAIRLDPKYGTAYKNRGGAWERKGEFDRAIADYNDAIRLYPKEPDSYNSRAWILATASKDSVRSGNRAIVDATRACELTDWKDWDSIDSLAAANAEAKNFVQAVKWQEKAIELAPDNQKADFRTRLALYKTGKPYRMKPGE